MSFSTRDPLSVPTITANFRRFITKVGPYFWLQDRIEEIIFWKRGWKRTTAWLAIYAFFCYYPRMTLLIPHIVLLAVMLHYYPGPAQINPGDTVDWQANIQAIQNLMGAFSDLHDTIVPLLPLLLPPQHTHPHHPLLIATLLSFLLLLPLLMTDFLPLRLLFFLAGAGTVLALHPCIKALPTALSRTTPRLSLPIPHLPNTLSLPTTHRLTLTPHDLTLFLRHLIDNDKLDDTVWPAPRAHVELWENERWIHETRRHKSIVTFGREEQEPREDDDASTGSPGTWSKANLKPNERVGWTRGRDGWCGVGGEVSGNLTFSLSPGWTFIQTEGWRADLSGAWAVEGDVHVGADQDGWTYTTDTWTHPRPDGRPTEGWVTRRRRWVRRVYFSGLEG